MFRRKYMPERLRPAWEAFAAQAERVEHARQVVLACLPVGRVQPAPVPAGLDVLRDELLAVREVLSAWHVPELGEEWRGCADAVDEALRGLERAHRAAVSSGELEELLGAVTDVVEPLDAWRTAERRWRALRVRG